MDKTTYEAAYAQLDADEQAEAVALKAKIAGDASDAEDDAETAAEAADQGGAEADVGATTNGASGANSVKAAAEAERDAEAKEFAAGFNDDDARGSAAGDAEVTQDAEQAKPPAKAKTFKEAFAQARTELKAGGPKVFEFNGKRYSTDVKGEAPKVAVLTAVSAVPAETEVAEVATVAKKPHIYEKSIAQTGPAAVKKFFKDRESEQVAYTGQRHASGKPNLAPAQ